MVLFFTMSLSERVSNKKGDKTDDATKGLYEPTIGLEIHAELKTRTKMFCDSPNNPDEVKPNVNICPVCMGHPGTLPVINKEAVRHVLRVGVSINGGLADFTEFDRKNYFYPDIPKGYQISQYKYPLVKGGILSGVSITRVHLEEDTATSLHEEGNYSLVDFNRAGVPLMELVTEPVIKNAEEAGRFARELQLLLRYLGASDANLEKGEMRIEANVSIARATDTADLRRTDAGQRIRRYDDDSFSGNFRLLGTKVEVKNLNSFKALEKAIAFEIERQTELLESGGKVVQETRGWDETRGETFSQRVKEKSHDYRYFPDPDLPKFSLAEIPEFRADCLKKGLPELPLEKRSRFISEFGISGDVAEILIQNKKLADFFEDSVRVLGGKAFAQIVLNYLTTDLMGLIKLDSTDSGLDKLRFSVDDFASLILMIKNKELSSRGAKNTLAHMYHKGGAPKQIAVEMGLIQKNNTNELRKIVEQILKDNQSVVADFKGGKLSAMQFLIGQGMKATKGSANPSLLAEIIKEII